jgi:hypothetical protein
MRTRHGGHPATPSGFADFSPWSYFLAICPPWKVDFVGSSTIGHCDACGYATGQLRTGGGIRNFQTYDAQPIHCAQCQEVRLANVKPPLVCLKCEMQKPGGHSAAASQAIRLPKVREG